MDFTSLIFNKRDHTKKEYIDDPIYMKFTKKRQSKLNCGVRNQDNGYPL